MAKIKFKLVPEEETIEYLIKQLKGWKKK